MTCPMCEDGTGWAYEPPYGWVCCSECNDDGQKPTPKCIPDSACWCEPEVVSIAANGNKTFLHKQIQ